MIAGFLCRVRKGPRMNEMAPGTLAEFRAWIASELQLLGNASHHAYSFGQANMAKRALERLDALLDGHLDVLLTPSEGRALLAALDRPEAAAGAELPAVRDRLRQRLS